MSASVLPAERGAALAAGCDAFLGKPYRQRELEAVLAALIEDPAWGDDEAGTNRGGRARS
ncbi:MAG: hypothetical protein ACRDGL_03175 [Candidatus Limnocylindrales bacterium]